MRKGLAWPWRRLATGATRPAARHARSTEWRTPGIARHAGGTGWRLQAARLARVGGWNAPAVLGRRGITKLAVRLPVVILLAGIPLLAVPIAQSMFASAVSPAPAASPRPGWTTEFSDRFSGAAGSGAGSAWTDDVGTQYHGTGCQGNWATGETETDTNSTANVSEDGSGHLDITPVNTDGAWTSGRIETVPEFTPPAGGLMKVTASIRQPGPASGAGYWAAFWMLGAGYRASGAGTSGTMNCLSWPGVGEINIMEDANARSQVSATLHCGITPGGPCNEGYGLTSGLRPCPGCQTGYQTYSVIINRTKPGDESVTWYLDGHAYYTVSESHVGAAVWQAAVDHAFFLILDVGIGGNFPDGACDCATPSGQTTSGAAMSVANVAVYTKDAPAPSSSPLSPASPTGQ